MYCLFQFGCVVLSMCVYEIKVEGNLINEQNISVYDKTKSSESPLVLLYFTPAAAQIYKVNGFIICSWWLELQAEASGGQQGRSSFVFHTSPTDYNNSFAIYASYRGLFSTSFLLSLHRTYQKCSDRQQGAILPAILELWAHVLFTVMVSVLHCQQQTGQPAAASRLQQGVSNVCRNTNFHWIKHLFFWALGA